MRHAVWVLSLLLAFCLENGAVWAADASVEDNREASFLPPPAALLPSTASSSDKEAVKEQPNKAPAPVEKKGEVKPAQPASAPVAEAKPAPTPPAAVTPTPIEPTVKPVATTPAVPSAAPTVPVKVQAVAPPPPTQVAPTSVTPPAAAAQSAVPVTTVEPPVPVVVQAPPPVKASPAPSASASAVENALAVPVPASTAPAKSTDQAITNAPLPDIDPETVGLLSNSNGGLGDTLWKDTSREFVDRLMPSIVLPTPSATLNDLARRAFLTTAALPVATADYKPQRNLVAERIEALVALGAVPEAWKLASLSKPELVDPVTLRQLTEDALIGPDSKEICAKVPELMKVHAKTDESATEWQKSLLICQLRDKDMKAVQLNLDMMRDQGSKDALFLSLVGKNVIGESKQLPRQLTPLRPTNLAVLRQVDIPLPSELYARPEAAVIPELLLAKAANEKARLTLAEKAGARGIVTPAQLAEVYKSVAVTPQDMASGLSSSESTVRSRAIAYQAALNEQGGQKKIELIERFISGVEPAVLTGAQIKLAADALANIPVTSDYNASSVDVARIFAMAGRPDKTLVWLKLAKDAAARIPAVEAQLIDSWPLFVLLGIVPDGEYAQGMKTWMAHALAEPSDKKAAKDTGERRERAGKILLLLHAAGYAVPEEGWQRVMEVAPPTKQVAPSPLIQERLRQASAEGRRGETVLLSLLSSGSLANEASLSALTEIVRALRIVGLTAEAQGLAREVVIGLNGG